MNIIINNNANNNNSSLLLTIKKDAKEKNHSIKNQYRSKRNNNAYIFYLHISLTFVLEGYRLYWNIHLR